MTALVFGEQEQYTSTLVSAVHRLPISCLSTFQIWREHCFLMRIFGMKLWAGFLWLSSYSHWPLCRALGGMWWLLFEKVVWFLLPGTQLNQGMISSAAHSLEFVAVAMKLWVILLAQMSLSLIPANLFGTGKPLGADCYCFMCLCGSEFWMTQSIYQQAFRTSYHLQRIPISPWSVIFF